MQNGRLLSTLLPLLRDLAEDLPAAAMRRRDWQIQPVTGGHNNLLFRATRGADDVAVKFTQRDGRFRARREYVTLSLLQEKGLTVAPAPLWLDETSFKLPVVVQTWLPGKVSADLPADDAEWLQIIRYLGTIHQITPANTTRELPRAVLTYTSAEEGVARAQRMAAKLPSTAVTPELQTLLAQLADVRFPTWSEPTLALSHCDPNLLNFVRRTPTWAAVDWENSGWGDPAFEVADLMAHPAYLDVPFARWQWVVSQYCTLMRDASLAERIWPYYRLMLLWWTLFFARTRYELAHGVAEKRLVQRPSGWAAGVPVKYGRYLALAQQSFSA